MNKHGGLVSLGVFPILSVRRLGDLVSYSPSDLREIANQSGLYYKPYLQKKNGKFRVIDNPVSPLKKIQQRIHRRILHTIVLPDTMMGGVKGKFTKLNAEIHIKQPVVVNIDLKNCFGRITDLSIYKVYHDTLGCGNKVASILTKLTTYHRHLPQGAPTSTTLCNLSLLHLYDSLLDIGMDLDLNISIWVDDITMSGFRAHDAIQPLIHLIQEQGYSVSSRKLKIMTSSKSQGVTGLTINRRPRVPKRHYETIRSEIVGLLKTSILRRKKICSIEGKVSYISQIEGSDSTRYKSLVRLLNTVAPESRIARRG
jgi:hypothetical protein